MCYVQYTEVVEELASLLSASNDLLSLDVAVSYIHTAQHVLAEMEFK